MGVKQGIAEINQNACRQAEIQEGELEPTSISHNLQEPSFDHAGGLRGPRTLCHEAGQKPEDTPDLKKIKEAPLLPHKETCGCCT